MAHSGDRYQHARYTVTTTAEKDAERNKTAGEQKAAAAATATTGNVEKRLNWENVKLVRTIDRAHDSFSVECLKVLDEKRIIIWAR
jgi:hypothetical protein